MDTSGLRAAGRRLVITGLAVGSAALFSCGSAVAAHATPGAARTTPVATAPTTATVPHYLFSIPSGSGSLIGANNQHLTLRLSDVRPYLTRFTDLPLRHAAVVANVDFARRFNGYFPGAAPNAVLTYTPPGGQIPVSIVLTIGAPHWNARRSTWTFPATRIRKMPDTLPGTTVRIRPPRIANPHRFTHATVLIDDSGAPVVDGCAIVQCPGTSDPIALPGGGVADALGGFLTPLFMTSITPSPGERFSIRLAVDYSYALARPDGTTGSPGLVPVFLLPPRSFDPATDPRVAPKSLMCDIESAIAAWQSADVPTPGGAFLFDLVMYGADPGQSLQAPVYTATLSYRIGPGAVASPGCG